MAYLVDCGCQQITDLCGATQRVCHTDYLGGELVAHCYERCLPVERVVCEECLC